MSLVPLTPTQMDAAERLVESGALEAVPPDAARASAFLRKARIKSADIENARYPENQFDLGYGACHDVGEALLSAYGYRTRTGPGQHIAVGRFLAVVIDAPPADAAARRYDRLRRIRNNQDYRAQPVSEADAVLAARCAEQLIAAATVKGIV